MPDEPLYDPDRMSIEDVDFTNLDMALAYLNHPVTDALCTDLGRSFRRLPAEVQRPEVITGLEMAQQSRAKMIELLDVLESTDPLRVEVEGLIARMDASIQASKLRLLELDDED